MENKFRTEVNPVTPRPHGSNGVQLHLGCGKKIIPGYINVDIQKFPGVDVVCDLRNLLFDDESVDLIYSCHTIEHFGRREWRGLLAHWRSKLKPGGKLRLATNCFEAAGAQYAERHNLEEVLGLMIGGQKDRYDFHKMIFDFATLKRGLEEVGFAKVRRYDWRKTDIGRLGIDDYSQSYLPHMDKKHGRLMSLNVEAEVPLPPKLGGRETRAGVFIVYDDWLKDKMFDLGSKANHNDVFERYVALQKFFGERNITLHTFDKYDNPSKVDVWLMFEPSRAVFRFILKNRINPRKVLLFLQEPPTVNPKAWKYLRLYQWAFKTIVTWNTDLCKKSSRFSHNFFPVLFDPASYFPDKDRVKKNLCVLMQSNKDPNIQYKSVELLSLRREVIRYFDKRGDNLLDLYGPGWNDARHPAPFFSDSYRGLSNNKRETLTDHYFAFCITNCNAPGYFMYDPFLAMSVGTVPIYYPMADSFKYIPQDTVINMKDFSSYDKLVAYLQQLIATGEYEEYRERGWQFLNSLEYWPFTIDQFCQDIYRAIRRVL